MIKFEGTIAPVTAESLTRCTVCHRYFTKEQENVFFNCADVSCSGRTTLDIHPSNGKFLTDEVVRESYWYHATDAEDWMGALLNNEEANIPLVHIGTEETAIEVILDKYTNSPYPISVYRIKLKETAVLHQDVFYDANEWPETLKDVRPEGSVYRYVNRWESAGSISLLVDPRELEIESVERLTTHAALMDLVTA